MATLQSAIDDFLDHYVERKFSKETVKNLFESKPEPKLDPKTKKLKEPKRTYISNADREQKLDNELLCGVIEGIVRGYTSNKKSAIEIFKEFIEFLKDEPYSIEVSVDFPPIDTSNSFERIMYLAKELQVPKKTAQDLADDLWTSVRNIENDIARLRGNTDDPMQICGRPFIVKDVSRVKGRKGRKGSINFETTAHPFFLTYNLSQVIATLKGLKFMSEDRLLKEHALLSAKMIWQQLSDYAKERVIRVATKSPSDNPEWYKNLEDKNLNAFYTEMESGTIEGPGVVWDCLKNEGRIFFVRYMDDGKIVSLNNCKVIWGKHDDDTAEITCDEGERTLIFKNIIRSAYRKEDLTES